MYNSTKHFISNGGERTPAHWVGMEKYLGEFSFPHFLGKDDFIPENIFYRLVMKAQNEMIKNYA